MNSFITLNEMHFFAHHGVSLQETLVGNEFTVNLRLRADIRRALSTDCVTDTVNYADVYNVIQAEMEQPSRLLEHVAGRIVKQLFSNFPLIESIELKLEKRNPPMGADIASAGIEIHIQRSERLENDFLPRT